MRPLLLFLACQATCLAASPLTVPMLDMSNTIREQEHIRIAALNPALCTAAQRHANHLAYISYGPNNLIADPHSWAGDGTPAQRAAAAGFRGTLDMPPGPNGWSTTGEIIAPRYTADVQSPFAGWLHSAGHRKSLLYDGFNVCGFGHAFNRQGQSIFVAMYGTEDRSSSTPADDSALAYEIVNAEASIGNYIPVQDAAVYLRVKRQLDGRTGQEQAEQPHGAYYEPMRLNQLIDELRSIQGSLVLKGGDENPQPLVKTSVGHFPIKSVSKRDGHIEFQLVFYQAQGAANVGEPVQGHAESIKGGHVQGPTQAPTQAPAAQCGPGGCGQAKAYYQPRRGVRAFCSCGGAGRRLALLPRNRR